MGIRGSRRFAAVFWRQNDLRMGQETGMLECSAISNVFRASIGYPGVPQFDRWRTEIDPVLSPVENGGAGPGGDYRVGLWMSLGMGSAAGVGDGGI